MTNELVERDETLKLVGTGGSDNKRQFIIIKQHTQYPLQTPNYREKSREWGKSLSTASKIRDKCGDFVRCVLLLHDICCFCPEYDACINCAPCFRPTRTAISSDVNCFHPFVQWVFFRQF